MTEEELKQFKELAKKYERGKDKEAVTKVFSDDIHEVFQDVHDKGHSAATAAKQKDVDALSNQLTTARSTAEELQRKLDGIKEAPDIATMRQKFEEDERNLRKQQDESLAKQKQEFEGKLQEKDGIIINTRLSVAKKDLVGHLVSDKLSIDPDYANTVLIAKPEVTSRLKVNDDGSVQVLKKGSTDMFIVPADGRTALDHLAEELAEGVDAKWKVSGAGRGSGTNGSQGGNATGSVADRMEAARTRVKDAEKTTATAKAAGSGLERLGARR